MLYILDTNILTALHLGHPKVLKAVQRIGNARVAITVVTKVELLRGRIDFLLKADRGEDLRRAQRLLIETEERLNEIEILWFDS